MLLEKSLSRLMGKKRSSRVDGQHRKFLYRPHIEALEERRILAVVAWDGGGDGTSWNDAGNWDSGGNDILPLAGDDVVIDLNTGSAFTLNLNVDVPAAEALGSFTLDSADATFSAVGRTFTVDGPANLQQGNVILNSSEWAGSGTLTNAADVIARGNSTISAPLVQNGNLTLEGTGFGSNLTFATGFTNSGTIVVDNQGVNNGNDLVITDGTLTNATTGVVTFVANSPRADSIRGDVDNQGTFNVNNTLRFDNTGSVLTNSGTLTIGTGASVTFAGNPGQAGGVFNQDGGTLDVDGDLALLDDTFNFNGGTVEGVVVLSNSALNIGAGATGAAEFSLRGATTLSGAVAEAQTIRIESLGLANASVTATQEITNAGTIVLERVAGLRSVALVVSGGNLVNAPTGTITFATGNGGNTVLDADLVNNGTVAFEHVTRLDGDTTQNNGTFLVSDGANVLVGAPGASPHIFQQNAGVLDIQGELSFDQDTFAYNGGAIVGTPVVGRSVLTLNTSNAATFQLLTNNAVNGPVAEGQTLLVQGNLDGGLAFSNFGTIVLGDDTAASGSVITVDGVFGNAGLVIVNETPGGDARIDATLNNQGAITLGDDLQVARNDAEHFNAGTITLDDARLRFGGAGSTFTNQQAGIVSLNPGSIAGSGTLDVAAVTFLNDGILSPGLSPGDLDILGDVVFGTTSGVVAEVGGTTAGTQFDQINISGSAALDGGLLVNVIDDFSPLQGDRFEILTYGSATGAFANVFGLSIAGSGVFTLDDTDPGALALEVALAVSDLAVQSVTVPAAATAGQEITVSYTVTNEGEPTTAGSWRDSIYLSADDTFDPTTDLLIARFEHNGDLGNQESYSETVTAPLPGVLPGDYRVIVVTNSSREVPDVNFANNIGVSDEQVAVDVEELLFDLPTSRQVVPGVNQFFRLNIPFGNDVRLRLNAPAGVVAGGIGFGQIPNLGELNFFDFNPLEGNQDLVLEAPVPGDYFLAFEGLSAGTFEVTAEQIDREIREIFPTIFGSTGEKTLTINGSGFSENASVILVNQTTGEEFAAASVSLRSSRTLSATFGDLPAGNYGVEVRQEGETTTAANSVEVVDNTNDAVNDSLKYEIIAPENVRPGRDFPVTVVFTNDGTTDLSAAMLVFEVVGGTVRFPDEEAASATAQVFLFAASDVGDPTIIAPGESSSIELMIRADTSAEPVDMSVSEIDPDAPLIDPNVLDAPIPAQLLAQVPASENSSVSPTTSLGSRDVPFAPPPANLNLFDTPGFDELFADFQSRFISAEDFGQGLKAIFDSLQPSHEATNPPPPGSLSIPLPGLGDLRMVPLGGGEFVEIKGRDIDAVSVPEGFLLTFNGPCTVQLTLAPDFSIRKLRIDDGDGPQEFPVINDGILAGFVDNEDGDLRDFLIKKGANIPSQPAARQVGANLDFLIDGDTVADFTNAVVNQAAATNTLAGSNPEFPKVDLSEAQDRFEEFVDAADPSDQISDSVQGINDVLGLGFTSLRATAEVFSEEVPNTGDAGDGFFVEELQARVEIGGSSILVGKFAAEDANESGVLNVEVEGSGGSSTFTFKRDASGKFRLESITDVDGRKLDAKTDQKGNLIELRDAQSKQLVFAVNENEDGSVDVFKDDGTSARLFKNPVDNTLREIAADGSSTLITYEEVNGVPRVASIDQDGEKRIFTYNPQGLLDTVKDQDGNVAAEYDYPRLDPGFAEVIVQFGDVEVRTPDGKTSIFELDKNGRVVKATVIDASGNVTVVTDREELLSILNEISGAGEVFRNDELLNEIEKALAQEVEGYAKLVETFRLQAERRVRAFELSIINPGATNREIKAEVSATSVNSNDPNDIIGPPGFGDQNFITKDPLLPYTIRFENQSEATAPAQEVFITHQLDADLDFSTFELGDVGFGDFVFDLPDGRSFFQGTFDVTAELGVLVELTAGLDVNTGLASWTFRSLDPVTGDLPFDALAGFLPPNFDGPEGEGFVNYTIRADDTVVTGDVLDAEATIIFDLNDPIDTPPILNTIDDGIPASSVDALPEFVDSTTFDVSWSGQDDPGGSGIASFDVFVSENGGPFELFLDDTAETSAEFTGEDGRRYGFFSVATDNVGFEQALPLDEQAFTTINLNAPPLADAGGPYAVNEGGSVELDASGTTDANQSTASLTFAWDLDGDGLFGETGANAERGDEVGISPTFQTNGLNGAGLNGLALKGRNINGPGAVEVDLLVTDAAGATDTATATINIANVAPSITSDNANVSVDEGGTANNTGSFSDPGPDVVTFTASVGAVVDNGDGTWTWSLATDDATPNQLVTITATDSDGASTDAQFQLTVNRLDDNSAQLIDGDLVVIGTDGDDVIRLNLDGSAAGLVSVRINGELKGSFTPGGIIRVDAGSGNDNVRVSRQIMIDSLVDGGPGHDTLRGGGGNDQLRGDAGNDDLRGGPGNDTLEGGSGNDRLAGGQGNDSLDGGAGNDGLRGQRGNDVLNGGDGDDFMRGGGDQDTIDGGGGNDLIHGNGGNDLVRGGRGNDALRGGPGNDILLGGPGDDHIDGRGGRDLAIGGTGADVIQGRHDQDIVVAGTTDHDDNDAALESLLAEWSGGESYAGRVDNISNGGGSLTGLGLFLNETTVQDDDAVDSLEGDGGQDLFFQNFEGFNALDLAFDFRANGPNAERRIDID